jgi:molybdopterin-guanine dinucleotide biosynthesis protein A
MNVEIDRTHGGPMIVVMQATLLVLAGGEGRRMGRTKAWLEVGETTLVRWVIDRLSSSFAEVIVSFAEPEQVRELMHYRIVFDRKPSAGPLAGLEAGLEAARNEVAFAVACDMPYVTPEIAEMAVAASAGCDAAIPRIDGRAEPTCAAYRRSALARITVALDAGRYKASDLAEQLDVTWLEGLDPQLFRSLNGPDDYERFRHELSRGDND